MKFFNILYTSLFPLYLYVCDPDLPYQANNISDKNIKISNIEYTHITHTSGQYY